MKRKEGFTLIELLVVMAIIAILAAIVVPNIVGWIGRARMTRAQAEIESIETSLAKMLTDASKSNLNDFLNPDGIRAETGWAIGEYPTAAQFRAVQEIYTNTFYALLRNGREVLKNDVYKSRLRVNAVKVLGISYLEIGFDPWGNLYQIFPTPWPREDSDATTPANPVIFRTYARLQSDKVLPGIATAQQDPYVIRWNPDNPAQQDLDFSFINEEYAETAVSFPAGRNPGVAFIYSFGANMKSGQMIYSSTGYSTTDKKLNYDNEQELDFMGGGDDVNNWDGDTTWVRFYN